MRAIVIIPTHDHGATLAITLRWLTQQTHRDFEAVVVGDGIPVECVNDARAAVAIDSRFRLIEYPKHARRGEPYRDEVLRQSSADIVCYLTDRDLWFPEHLATMIALLQHADYAHSIGVHVLPDGALRAYACDLAQPGYRHMLLTTNDNRMPFSSFGHRMSAYCALPEGWTETPANEWTDLYMIRKFIRLEHLIGASGLAPTAVTFPSPPRKDWSHQARFEELKRYSDSLSEPVAQSAFKLQMLQAALRKQREDTGAVAEAFASVSQRLARIENAAQRPSFTSLRTY
jgi:glycosyltransferase involved in cell wall biosynthesis